MSYLLDAVCVNDTSAQIEHQTFTHDQEITASPVRVFSETTETEPTSCFKYLSAAQLGAGRAGFHGDITV